VLSLADLDLIARARLDDAKALLTAGRYDGAGYLCGYAVEVALKARICRVLNWSEFPSTSSEFQAYRSFQTHELDVLLRLSGQEPRIKGRFFSSWNAVAIWKAESRYDIVGKIQKPDAESMIVAAEELLRVL
jgi:HEPN domain-containing protein